MLSALGAGACAASPAPSVQPSSAPAPTTASAAPSSVAPEQPALVEADVPSAEDAVRDAQLAAEAADVIDAFTDTQPRVATTGRHIVFRSTRDGLPQLYAIDLPKMDSSRRLVSTDQRVAAFRITRDGQSVVFVSDRGADENFAIYRVGIDGTGLQELTPGQRLHRDLPYLPHGRDVMVYSARSHNDASTMVVRQALEPQAEPAIAYKDASAGTVVDVNRDGTLALFVRINSLSDQRLLLVDLDKGTATNLYPPEGQVARVHDASFSSRGDVAFVATDGGAEQALLLALELPTGKERGRYVEQQPSTAELRQVVVARTGGLVAVLVDAGNRNEVRLLDSTSLRPRMPVRAPLGSGALTEFSSDGKALFCSWSTPDKPHDLHLVSLASGAMRPVRQQARPTIDKLPEMTTSIETVEAFDGLSIPVNVYLPKTANSTGKAPVLVMIHGGPADSSSIRWNPVTRFYVAQGWVVLEPNIRGSTGFGRAYEMADDGPKRLDALKDVEAVAQWARKQPFADPQRLVIWGGSYGGYMVLMGMTRQQHLWAAGVEMVGPSNWRSFMRSTTGQIRQVLSKEFGSVEHDGAFLDSISPLRDVDRITSPLFVYQGQNDPRVPRPESDQIVRSLRQRKVAVEYMIAPDEGHSLDRRDTKVEFLARSTRFLEKHLNLGPQPPAAK